MIAQVGVQSTGAVKALVSVNVQVASAENTATTSTLFPSAVNPVSVTVCGLDVIAKLCPFTFNVPLAGGVEYVTVTSCV